LLSPARVTVTVQLPADEDVNDGPIAIEHPDDPGSDTLNE
jgi:hypothetical protein